MYHIFLNSILTSHKEIYFLPGYRQKVKDIVQGALFPEAGLDNRVGHARGVGGLVIVQDLDLLSYCESCLLHMYLFSKY